MEDYNKKFINLWNRFVKAIGATDNRTPKDIIDDDERFKKDNETWHDYRKIRNIMTHQNDFAAITKSLEVDILTKV